MDQQGAKDSGNSVDAIPMSHGRGVFVEWEPILWFVNGKSSLSKDYVSDFIRSDPPGKLLHRWAQSRRGAEYYIDYLTPTDGVDLDPMIETRTTGDSAVTYGRDFIGIEKPRRRWNCER
jgi:DNA modification methylase